MHGSTNLQSIFTTIFGGASSNEGMSLFNFGLDWQYIQSTCLSLQFKQQVNSWIRTSEGTIDFNRLDAVGLSSMTSNTVRGYFSANLAIQVLITHVLIFYRKDMDPGAELNPTCTTSRRSSIRKSLFGGTGCCSCLPLFAGLIVTIRGETTLPAWDYLIAVLLGAFIGPFSCVHYGLYSTGISTNQLSEMVAGALHPGRPLANQYFASWSH